MDANVEIDTILNSPQKLNEKCDALIAYGTALEEQKSWGAMELAAVKCLGIHPGHRPAYQLLGRALAGSGRPQEAQKCFNLKCPDTIVEKYFGEKGGYTRTTIDSNAGGIDVLFAYPSKNQSIPLPKSIADLNSDKFDCTELQSPAANIVHIKQGRMWYDGDNTVVWDKQGNIVSDLSRGNTDLIARCTDSFTCVAIPGSVCLLGDKGTVNYYHWLNDALPGLCVLQQSGVGIDTIDQFIARPLKKPFHKQTLAKFGIEADRLNDSIFIETDNLFVPTFGRNNLGRNQQSWVPEFLGSMFPYEETTSTDLKIYISRGDSGARGVTNESEVIEIIEKIGFKIVKLQELQLKDQAALFAQASVVLGPHGAGFTNTVFCKPGTKVIEFYGEHVEPCFWITSELLGLDHYAHYCHSKEQPAEPTHGHAAKVANRLSGIHIDVTELEKLLSYADVK